MDSIEVLRKALEILDKNDPATTVSGVLWEDVKYPFTVEGVSEAVIVASQSGGVSHITFFPSGWMTYLPSERGGDALPDMSVRLFDILEEVGFWSEVG